MPFLYVSPTSRERYKCFLNHRGSFSSHRSKSVAVTQSHSRFCRRTRPIFAVFLRSTLSARVNVLDDLHPGKRRSRKTSFGRYRRTIASAPAPRCAVRSERLARRQLVRLPRPVQSVTTHALATSVERRRASAAQKSIYTTNQRLSANERTHGSIAMLAA